MKETKIRIRHLLTLCFNTWWLPFATCLAALAAFTVTAIPCWKPLASLTVILLGVAFLGLLSASIRHLRKRRWAKGILNLLMLLVCGIATVLALGVLMFTSMFGPSEDGFADNLTIPQNIAVFEPKKEPDSLSVCVCEQDEYPTRGRRTGSRYDASKILTRRNLLKCMYVLYIFIHINYGVSS